MRDDADRERDARAINKPRPDVASLNVGTEPVVSGGRTQLIDQIDTHRIVASDDRRSQGEQDKENHDAGAEPGARIAS